MKDRKKFSTKIEDNVSYEGGRDIHLTEDECIWLTKVFVNVLAKRYNALFASEPALKKDKDVMTTTDILVKMDGKAKEDA